MMEVITQVILYSLVSGITIIIGGLLASADRFPDTVLKEEILHGIIAFGGGVLIAAVAFVLVPKGMALFSIPALSLTFLFGAVVFLLLDRFLSQRGGKFAQLMAMLMDFIPEATALGAIFAHEPQLGLLLAIFIGLQNLPEGFNSYRDLIQSGYSRHHALLILTPLSLLGMIGAILGYLFLNDSPQIIAALMLFAGGGILYLTFQDIAPMSKLKNHWSPPLGAALGFTVGMIGQKMLG